MTTHLGQKFKTKVGFEVGYSKSLMLGDNRLLHLPKEQNRRFESGGKVILPQILLTEMTEKELIGTEKPMQFRLHSTKTNILCLVGIFDFHSIAEDLIFIPKWMFEYLGVIARDNLFFSDMKLPQCTFIKFKPESCDFYKIGDAKQFLTNSLELYSAICQGQWICLTTPNDMKSYWFQVVECKPELCSLVNTNVNVDFQSADGLDAYEREQKLNKAFERVEEQMRKKDDEVEIVKTVVNDDEKDVDAEMVKKQAELMVFKGKGRKL